MKSHEFQRLYGHGGTAPAAKPAIRMPRLDKMTKVEAEYGRLLSTEFYGLSYDIRFEAITFKLPGGSRYTPDWTVWLERSLLLAVECKGAFRLGSAGRSHTAFKECIAAFPNIIFRFAQKSKDGWSFLNSNDKIPR